MGTSDTVVVLGTGDFGRALTKKLIEGGFQVTVGSRHPGRRNLTACDVTLASANVTSVQEAVTRSDVIFLAVHYDNQSQFKEMEGALADKILIDVSNVEKRDEISNAEKLQELLPSCTVVKAFNTQSAYTIMNGHASSNRDVHVAADKPAARTRVMEIAQRMGFNPVNAGPLQSARDLEAGTTTLFRGWGAPLIFSLIVFCFWFIYGTIRYHYIAASAWDRFPVNTINKELGCTAITLLACCYLPGCFAAFAQLIHGTKHRRFPAWLDRWLRMRKQLGLTSLLVAAAHCVLSVAHLSPGYMSDFFDGENEIYVPPNSPDGTTFKIAPRMTWQGECVLLFGTMALGLMCVLGITSLPSVGAQLNWRQWSFIQSSLGYVVLFLATVHLAFDTCPDWVSTPFESLIQNLDFLAIIIPLLTLFLALLLLTPCLCIPLRKIRRGHEYRQVPVDEEQATEPKQHQKAKKENSIEPM